MPDTDYIAVHTDGKGGWTWRLRAGGDPDQDHAVKDRGGSFEDAGAAADDAEARHPGHELRVER